MNMIRLYTFLIFVAIVTAILYVFFILPQSDYVGKTSLLIIPQTEVIASNADNVTNNIVFITQSVINNDKLKDDHAKVDVVRLPQTNIVQFVVFAESINEVRSIKNKTIQKALTEVSKYYNINTDFTIKVVKGEVTHKTNIVVFAPYFVAVIVGVGLIAGLLALFYMIDLYQVKSGYDENIDGEKIFSKYRPDEILYKQQPNISSDIDVEVNTEDTKNNIERNKEQKNKKITPVDKAIIPETEIIKDKTVASVMPEGFPTTPGNLPVADVSDFGLENQKTVLHDDTTEDIEELIEPTEEELKARLNELLGGKL